MLFIHDDVRTKLSQQTSALRACGGVGRVDSPPGLRVFLAPWRDAGTGGEHAVERGGALRTLRGILGEAAHNDPLEFRGNFDLRALGRRDRLLLEMCEDGGRRCRFFKEKARG